MSGICTGRVVVVTGAGRGLGRAHALAFAAEVVDDDTGALGGERQGVGAAQAPARAGDDDDPSRADPAHVMPPRCR